MNDVINMENYDHPFADLIGLSINSNVTGKATATLTLEEKHLNPHRVAHGTVIYAMADTAMGAALRNSLPQELACVTLDINITYFRPAFKGTLICSAKLENMSKRFGHISADIMLDGKLIAKTVGNFAIIDTPPTPSA